MALRVNGDQTVKTLKFLEILYLKNSNHGRSQTLLVDGQYRNGYLCR